MDREQVVALQHQRFAAKKYDPNRRISQKDWEALVEVGRLAPSSIGLEPWKMLLLKNERMKEDLKPIAWGALSSLEGASHFVIYLARKGVTYDSDYVKKVMHEVKKGIMTLIPGSLKSSKISKRTILNSIANDLCLIGLASRLISKWRT
ncbi:hypothetical protein BTM408_12320 [Helicobacter pylori]